MPVNTRYLASESRGAEAAAAAAEKAAEAGIIVAFGAHQQIGGNGESGDSDGNGGDGGVAACDPANQKRGRSYML